MTISDDKKFCWPCKKLGMRRKAHRITPGGPRCDEHFREEYGLPQLNDEGRAFIERCKELERGEIRPRKGRGEKTCDTAN